MDVFILSAGQQMRFPDNYCPKQLLEINNETILARQVRQLKDFNLIPFVVTKNPLIINQSPKFIIPECNDTVLDTLKSTIEHWRDDRILILLGDVFYSKQLFANIMASTIPLKFWLTGSEIFAISFDKSKINIISKALDFCLYQRRMHEKKLWHLYRNLNNGSLNLHKIYEGPMTGDIIVDYSFDIDSLVQYNDVSRFVEILKQTNSDP